MSGQNTVCTLVYKVCVFDKLELKCSMYFHKIHMHARCVLHVL